MLQIWVYFIIVLTGALAIRGLSRPGVILALVWGTFAIEQVLQQNPFFLARQSLINIGLAAMLGATVTWAVLTGKLKGFKFSITHFFYLALVGIVALSYFWSISQPDTFRQMKRQIPYILTFSMVAPLCCFNQKQLDSVAKVYIYFGSLLLLGIAASSTSGRSIVVGVSQGSVVTANPLAVASFGGHVVICSIFHIYTNRSRLSPTTLLAGAIVLLGLYVILRSGSRGQMLAAVAACFIWLPITAKMAANRSSIIALVIAFLIAYGAIWLAEEYELANRWRRDLFEQHLTGRLDAASYVIQQMLDAGPMAWLVGLGNSACYKLIGVYPHNVPAEVLAEEGILGFACFLGFLVSVTLTGLRFMLDSNADASARARIGMMLTLFTFEFGLCLKQGSLLGSPLLFGFGLGVVNCILMDPAKKKSGLQKGQVLMAPPAFHVPVQQ